MRSRGAPDARGAGMKTITRTSPAARGKPIVDPESVEHDKVRFDFSDLLARLRFDQRRPHLAGRSADAAHPRQVAGQRCAGR